MKKEGIAIVTGGDGDMGQIITMACALSGYRTVMACRELKSALPVRDKLRRECPDTEIEAEELDLTSRDSVRAFVALMKERGQRISILVNNAGVLSKKFSRTADDIEMTTAVNYLGPYMLSRLLLPLMGPGSRIVNTVSITYRIGKIPEDFFPGTPRSFSRIPLYANSKLALLLFTIELSKRVRDRGITVNAADPGIVSTKMIRFDKWFDPLTDLLFRPLIKTSMRGAQTAIMLALSESVEGITGKYYANCRRERLPDKIYNHPCRPILWDKTEEILSRTPGLVEAMKENDSE